MSRFSSPRYTTIGYVVSKVGMPLAKRAVKRKARSAVRGSAKRSAGAAIHNPARTSIAIGSAIGAIAWLARRRRYGNYDLDG